MDAYVHALDALGDARRREIVGLLRAGPKSVGELAAALPVTRPAVSQHLGVLKAARLVADTRAGTRRLYRLDPAGLDELRAYVEGFWDDALAAFKAVADAEREEGG